MRIFTHIRRQFSDIKALRIEVEQIKEKVGNQNKNIELVFQYLDELLEKKENPKVRKAIGYKTYSKK